MARSSETVRRAGIRIETYIDGDGPTLVILPSYGRDGGQDYDDITARTARAGWRVLRPQPRGAAGSAGPMSGVTLHDLADDVVAVIRDLGTGDAPSCSATPSGMPWRGWWRLITPTSSPR